MLKQEKQNLNMTVHVFDQLKCDDNVPVLKKYCLFAFNIWCKETYLKIIQQGKAMLPTIR